MTDYAKLIERLETLAAHWGYNHGVGETLFQSLSALRELVAENERLRVDLVNLMAFKHAIDAALDRGNKVNRP